MCKQSTALLQMYRQVQLHISGLLLNLLENSKQDFTNASSRGLQGLGYYSDAKTKNKN